MASTRDTTVALLVRRASRQGSDVRLGRHGDDTRTVLTPQDVLRNIETDKTELCRAAESVRCLQHQCTRLVERVAEVVGPILEALGADMDRVHRSGVERSLLRLSSAIRDGYAVLETLRGHDYLRAILRRGSHARTFRAINAQLRDVALALDIGINVPVAFNHDHDADDERKDRADIGARHAELVAAARPLLAGEKFADERLQSVVVHLDRIASGNDPQHDQGDTHAPPGAACVDSGDACVSVPFHALSFGDEIGSGTFARVYRGAYDNSEVAVKRIHALGGTDDEATLTLIAEVRRLADVRHQHVCAVIGLCAEPGRVALLLEYAEQKSLHGVLRSDADISWALRWRMVSEAARGVAHLHGLKPTPIVHGAIKTTNLLVDRGWRVKVADFGLSSVFSAIAATLPSSSSSGQQAPQFPWAAPELLRSQADAKATTKSDAYSFGFVLCEVAARKTAWEGDIPARIVSRVLAGERPDLPEDSPVEVTSLACACWGEEPSGRPTFTEIAEKAATQVTARPPSAGSRIPVSPSRPEALALDAKGPFLGASGASGALTGDRISNANVRRFWCSQWGAKDSKVDVEPFVRRVAAEVPALDDATQRAFLTGALDPEGRGHVTAQHLDALTGGAHAGEPLEAVMSQFAPCESTIFKRALDAFHKHPFDLRAAQERFEMVLGDVSAPSDEKVRSHLYLSRLYSNGWGGKMDEEASRAHGEAAAQVSPAIAAHGRAVELAPDDVPLVLVYERAVRLLYGVGVAADPPAAASLLFKGAARGCASSQLGAGVCSEHGLGTTRDETAAASWYSRAATQGHPSGMFKLAVCYVNGHGVPRNPREAFAWYKRAAERHRAKAMRNLAACYEKGVGTGKDLGAALEWYMRAGNQEDAPSQFRLAVLLLRSGGSKNEREGMLWMRRAAENGVAPAMFRLAGCYAVGSNMLERDEDLAAEWYLRAAESGHAEAQLKIAACYEEGAGVPRDDEAAAAWYYAAAKQGIAEAQYCIGDCFARGVGVRTDAAEGMEWMRRAAVQGHAPAQYRLGQCYATGTGVERDHGAALEWSLRAARQGHTDAMFYVGQIYNGGKLGASMDRKRAVEWFKKAAAQGHDGAIVLLRDLTRS